jgi:hypothetical protein
MPFKAATRPNSALGGICCNKVCRMIILMLSKAPIKTRKNTESQIEQIMKQILPFSHTLYAKLYSLVLSVLLAYCLFNAIYSVIIGGKSVYLFSSLILIFQTITVFKASVNKKIYNYMGLIGLILSLVYLNHWMFLSQTESIAILPSVILTLLSLGYFSQQHSRLNLLKAALIFGLLVLAYTQYHDLNTLQNYYNSLHTGETWQQYGAL